MSSLIRNNKQFLATWLWLCFEFAFSKIFYVAIHILWWDYQVDAHQQGSATHLSGLFYTLSSRAFISVYLHTFSNGSLAMYVVLRITNIHFPHVFQRFLFVLFFCLFPTGTGVACSKQFQTSMYSSIIAVSNVYSIVAVRVGQCS